MSVAFTFTTSVVVVVVPLMNLLPSSSSSSSSSSSLLFRPINNSRRSVVVVVPNNYNTKTTHHHRHHRISSCVNDVDAEAESMMCSLGCKGGWLVCEFCEGQKTNVKAQNNNRIYRRCPTCRAVGYVLCSRCKVYKCLTFPDFTDDRVTSSESD